MVRKIIAFITGAVLTAILMIAVSTQNTFAGLRDLGASAGLEQQLKTTINDILGTGPILIPIVALGFIVALPCAGFVARRLPKLRGIIYFVAGMVCIFVVLFGMQMAFFGTPLMQGAREPLWMFLTMLCGGIGAWLFSRLTRTRAIT